MFGHESKPTIVYRYDVRTKMTPCMETGFVREQLWLANLFRHKLIDAELAGRKAYREARSAAYPDFAALEENAAKANAEVESIAAEIAKANARERRKRAMPEEKGRLAVAKDARKVAVAALKKRRADIAGTSLSEAADVAREAITEQAHAWANKAGLFQGTKWAMVRSMFQAMKTAKEDPRHLRWDGTGRLSVQLQAQKVVMERKGPATWANIALGRWGSHISFRREGKWTIFRVRFGSDANGKPLYVECPIVLHRDWPEDAVCKWVELVCTRTGREYRYSLCFSLAREAGWDKPRACDGAVGINLGWRLVKDGLRVACWSGSDGREGELVIPHDRLVYYKAYVRFEGDIHNLSSLRDQLLNEAKPLLASHLAMLPAIPEAIAEAAPHLHAIRSKSKVLAMVNALPEAPPLLAEWRRKEIHLERWQSDQRAKFERWRKDLYRRWWAEMRKGRKGSVHKGYSVAYLPKVTWKRAKPGPHEDSEGGMVEWRACASPGLLAMLGDGYAETVEAKNLSRECHACRGLCDVGEPLFHTCEHCGLTWDQDMNAARNALARGKVMV